MAELEIFPTLRGLPQNFRIRKKLKLPTVPKKTLDNAKKLLGLHRSYHDNALK